MSNAKWFRYEWIWHKSQATQFLDANRRPLKAHESVLVFASERTTYYPVMGKGESFVRKSHGSTELYGAHERMPTHNTGTRYPTTILKFDSVQKAVHPTQKPVALFEYLIRTYTQPGELVLDPCVGSGTTALAARNTGRHYVCGDSSAEYVALARARLAEPYTPPMFASEPAAPDDEQLSFSESEE